MEIDPAIIMQRIAIKVSACLVLDHNQHEMLQIDDGAFTEQSVKQVLQSAKENLKWSLLK